MRILASAMLLRWRARRVLLERRCWKVVFYQRNCMVFAKSLEKSNVENLCFYENWKCRFHVYNVNNKGKRICLLSLGVRSRSLCFLPCVDSDDASQLESTFPCFVD